ncbi:YihY/virulence factor BrkB family protein [Lacticaseibacillus saniviri]|uniref:YihY/virulence factor BrkB family protein n=1 Tax=Lacticaseibacillus saniviri TaxID=931533 RepID=UPI0006CF35D2|nr:YihY/virulence factor BrkB family protein [Lacticaseibacillus saniviri]
MWQENQNGLEQAHKKPVPLSTEQQQAIHQGHIPLATLDVPNKYKRRALLKLTLKRFNDSEAGTSAASLAYYALLSLFPMLLVVGNLLPYLHLDYRTISDYLAQIIPSNIMSWLEPVIQNLLQNGSGGVLSIGAVTTLWAASLGINGLKLSFNKAYGVSPSQNFIVQRLLSMLLTFLMILAVATVLVMFAFGQQFLEWLNTQFGLSDQWLKTFLAWRWPVTLLVVLIAVTFLFYFLPNVRIHFWTVLPGAVFTTLGWIVLAQSFSLYMRYFGTRYSSYGTLGTFIILLLWLNFSAWVLIVGAILNALVAEYFTGHLHSSPGKVADLIRNQRAKD